MSKTMKKQKLHNWIGIIRHMVYGTNHAIRLEAHSAWEARKLLPYDSFWYYIVDVFSEKYWKEWKKDPDNKKTRIEFSYTWDSQVLAYRRIIKGVPK